MKEKKRRDELQVKVIEIRREARERELMSSEEWRTRMQESHLEEKRLRRERLYKEKAKVQEWALEDVKFGLHLPSPSATHSSESRSTTPSIASSRGLGSPRYGYPRKQSPKEKVHGVSFHNHLVAIPRTD